jgi:hypothetical protein
MKKTINGKTYNTETAKEIGSWSNNYYYNDFNHCQESLYVTKKGNYFIHGSGGPMSKYSVSVGNNCWGGSSDIIALTESEALEWAEEHDQDAVKHFSHLLEEA